MEENFFTCLVAFDHESFWCPRTAVESFLDDPANATKNLSTASFSNTVALLVELKSTAALKGSGKNEKLNTNSVFSLSFSSADKGQFLTGTFLKQLI